MEKSHVSLEQLLCVVTGQRFDTDAILIDRSLQKSLNKFTVTGWGYAPEVREKLDKGYLALVEIDYDKSEKDPETNVILPEHVYRLGTIAYIKKTVFKELFPDLQVNKLMWVSTEFINGIANLLVKDDDDDNNDNNDDDDGYGR